MGLPPRQSRVRFANSNTAETTVSENNKSFSVTIQPPMPGRRKVTAWVWRYVSRFAPTVNDKNVLCLEKQLMELPSNTS